jgi:hypothetical protein
MKDPSPYDEDGRYAGLGRGDKQKFRKLFTKKYEAIDIDRAKESYISTFQASDAPEYRLFKDVVNSFSSNHAADGSNSGFETTIVNPLFEFGDSGAEVLLAEKHPTGIHLCFVSCNAGGEEPEVWRQEINTTRELLCSDNHREHLLSHIRCSGLSIRTVQYLTFTREHDLVDVDMEVMKIGTEPENYAVWKLVEVEPSAGEHSGHRSIRLQDGHIEHPDLRRLSQNGIDPTRAENDDIMYCLTSHPVFPLGEVCMQLYLDKEREGEEPEEFIRSEFAEVYRDKVEFGENREGMEEHVTGMVDSLLETALDYDIVVDDEDEVEERDYRIRWDTEDAGDIKDMVKKKFFKKMAPDEMGYLAFDRAWDEFDPEESSLGDFTGE